MAALSHRDRESKQARYRRLHPERAREQDRKAREAYKAKRADRPPTPPTPRQPRAHASALWSLELRRRVDLILAGQCLGCNVRLLTRTPCLGAPEWVDGSVWYCDEHRHPASTPCESP